MSHNIHPVCGAHGRTRKVDGSGSIMTSAAPSHSGLPNAPPAFHTGNAVQCEVSLSSIVLVKPTPLVIALPTSPAVSVLPRNRPCWSAKDRRTTVSSPAWTRRSTSRAAVRRSSFHSPAFSARCITASLRDQRRRRLGGPARLLSSARVELLPVVLPADGRAHAVDRHRAAYLCGALGIEPHRRLAAARHLADRR